MSQDEHKRLVRLYFEEALTGNGDIYEQILSENFQVHAIHGKYSPVVNVDNDKGPQAFKSFPAALRQTWAELDIRVDQIIAEADWVAAVWTLSGIQRGQFLGIPPTGRRVTYSGINLFRVANGKLAEAWDMMDRLSLWQQLGVLPETAEFLAQAKARMAAG